MVRKGMGKGRGKGFKNLIPRDSKTHSNSAKGIKQPQKLSPRVEAMLRTNPDLKNKSFKQLQNKGVFLKSQGDTDKDGVVNIKDCKPLDKSRHQNERTETVDIEQFEKKLEPTKKEKAVKAAKQTGILIGKTAVGAVKGGVKILKERAEKKKREELKALDKPELKKLISQESRVQELRTQLKLEEKTDEIEKLGEELDNEEQQLREAQEKVTNIKLDDYSDSELRTLAIRLKDDDSIFSGLFSGSGNKYKDELLRRIKSRADIDREEAKQKNEESIEKAKLTKELKKERLEALKKEDDSLFGGIF